MPSAIAGRESVTRLIQSNCIEMNGDSRQINIAMNTESISLTLVLSKNPTTFFMLAKMPPSR